jgi:exosome complex component RRP41
MAATSIANLRNDGRRYNEFRKINFKINNIKNTSSDGSVYYEQGNNKIIVSIIGPKVTAKRNANKKKCNVKCEYSTSPFAALGYRRSGNRDKTSISEANTIKNIFEGVILTNLLPSSEINIFINILQSDGGALCSSINAVSLALIHAGIPCLDFVIATTCCNIANINDLPQQDIQDGAENNVTASVNSNNDHFSSTSKFNLVDLNHTEINHGYPQIEVAILPNLKNKICFLRMANRVDMQIFQSMLHTAKNSCNAIQQLFKTKLLENHRNILQNQQQQQKHENNPTTDDQIMA